MLRFKKMPHIPELVKRNIKHDYSYCRRDERPVVTDSVLQNVQHDHCYAKSMTSVRHEKRSYSGDGDEEVASKKILLDEEVEEEVVEEADIDLKVEKIAGICEYTGPHVAGFVGVIKQRISDFHVNEIDRNNQVVHLDSFEVPVLEKPKVAVDTTQVARLKSILGVEKFNELNEFCNKNDLSAKYQLVAPQDKQDRKLVHDYIKANFTKYSSNTVQGTNKSEQLIDVFHKCFNGHDAQGAFRRNDKIPINYCQFVLYKDNIDTIQAVNQLAKHLRLQSKRISYAGTKDKRAKTTQLMAIFKMEPKDIIRLNERTNQLKVGNFSFIDEALKLGDLNGNRFTIVLRQVEGEDSVIENSLKSLRENGFINYYGLQRFGSTDVATHDIGKNLLKNNFKEAIDLILKPRKSLKEKNDVKKARDVWEKTQDAKEAFKAIQYCNCLEKFLLMGLCECDKNDYLGAFNYIPRNMRLMYIHAYQSYVWNMVASERVRRHGLKPIVGDLVYDKTKSEKIHSNVVQLNEADLSSYEIDDVLLPLPGFTIKYPGNELAEYYKNLLETDGLDIQKMKNPIKEFSLTGDYRNLIGRPAQIEHEIVYYKDQTIDLVLSDYEKLNGTELKGVSRTFHETDHPIKALVLSFNLKTSSYATMALREILKLDTSSSYQASLNKS